MSLPAKTVPPATTATRLAGMVLPVLLLAGCAGEEPGATSSPAQPPAVPGSAWQVETRVGDASVTAVAIQTSQLPAVVAAEHDIPQRDDLVMLRISARQGDIGNITTAPVEVQAAVTLPAGGSRDIELDEHLVNGLVDHVGTLEVALPATLQFEVAVTTPAGERELLVFSRHFETR